MALEPIVAKKELIPAGLEAHYVERAGAWHLDVTGDAVAEYRKNNIALAEQLRAQAKRYEGIDPEAVRAEKTRLEAEKAKLSALQLDQAVVAEATKRGLRGSALPDITARAKNTFRLVDGVPQAVDSDGKTALLGKDGLTPLSVAEWMEAQVSTAPHLFESNAGGGAVSNVTGGGAGGNRVPAKNPFKKESLNITEQWRLRKTDPALAARLAAAA